MLRLMIVDDEKIILDGVRSFIEKKLRLPFLVDIMTASNAVEALELLNVFVPDLILTDIRMPVVDGFEFIRKVREKGIECDVAILTSHADFEYARRAVSFHVEDFLLKPIDLEALRKVLENSFEKVEKGRAEEEREVASAVRNVLLYDLPPESVLEDGHSQMLFPYQYFTVVLVETDEQQKDYGKELEYEISYFYPICRTFYFFQRRQYVTVCNHDRFFVDTSPLKHNLQKLLGIQKTVSISISSNSWTELHALYMNAQRRLLHQKINEGREEAANVSFITYQDCVDILLEGSQRPGSGLLKKYLDKALSLCPDSVRLFQDIGNGFIQNCNLYLSSLDMPLLEHSFDEKIGSREELEEKIAGVVRAYNRKQNEEKRTENPDSVEKMCTYISMHYREDISLEQLAEIFGMHPNYICGLFKKHMGESFLVYLQKLRVQAAKELLAAPEEHTLDRIAEQVGFHGANQMIRVFKKYENMTPGEYKRLQE